VCVNSFSSTIHRTQGPLHVYRCVQINSVLLSSLRRCVTETWFNSNVPDSLMCPKGYAVFRHDRDTPGGGVAIFARDVICAVTVDIPAEFKHVEAICVDLTFQRLHAVLYACIANPVSMTLMLLT